MTAPTGSGLVANTMPRALVHNGRNAVGWVVRRAHCTVDVDPSARAPASVLGILAAALLPADRDVRDVVAEMDGSRLCDAGRSPPMRRSWDDNRRDPAATEEGRRRRPGSSPIGAGRDGQFGRLPAGGTTTRFRVRVVGDRRMARTLDGTTASRAPSPARGSCSAQPRASPPSESPPSWA